MDHYLYAIELEGYKKPHRPPRPWVYVGQSTKTPRARFEEHKDDENLLSHRVVHQHGKRLIEKYSPNRVVADNRQDAELLERRLAEDLRAEGYSVYSDGGPLWPIGHVVGQCPVCGRSVKVRKRVYSCVSNSCDFRFKARYAGRVLPNKVVSQLIRSQRTERPVAKFSSGEGGGPYLTLNRIGSAWRVGSEASV